MHATCVAQMHVATITAYGITVICAMTCATCITTFSMEIVLAGEDLATFVTDHLGAPFMSYIHVIGQSFS